MVSDKYIAKANQLFIQGEYEDAIRYYRLFQAQCPEISHVVTLNIIIAEKKISKQGCKVICSEILQ